IYRKVMTDSIKGHNGRVVDAKGDNVLAEFASVVDAIEAAVEIQKQIKTKNEGLPENRRMRFRIGVNLGDVIEKADTIYGDGVNIAARLESLAEGGGICISGTAFDQVGKKLPLGYRFMGEQQVKNIEKPVRAYKVLLEPEAAGKVMGERPRMKTWQWTAIFGLIILIVVGGALTLWEFYVRPDIVPASIEKMAHPLPDKPSIAVLPFDNMSKNPDENYFSDGLTEEIITGLAKVPDVFVIARNSTFTYKGKPVKIQQVAEELGVQYVLEGSVRKTEDRIRITAQLIDALDGKHVWAEKYDRPIKDIFEVQDEITFKILTAMHINITKDTMVKSCPRGTNNVEAYTRVLKGKEAIYKMNLDGNAMGRALSEEAVAIDPGYSTAYCMIAFTHIMDIKDGGSKAPQESLKKAFELIQKSLTLESTCAFPYVSLSYCYLYAKQHDKAIAAGENAIRFDPNDAFAHSILALILALSGRAEEALPIVERSMRLNPKPPGHFFGQQGVVYYQLGMLGEAVTAFKNALAFEPNGLVFHVWLAPCYIEMGKDDEARAEVATILKLSPNFSLAYRARTAPYKNQADLDRHLNALAKAGLK
ncbi:MAG: adenylate/guanylate cyclase domain-containing protein, partial [Desulfobacteraceae bacterium]